MFEPHKLSEVMSALFSGRFPNAREHSRLRLRVWSIAGAEDGLTARNAGLSAMAWGEFPEGASGRPGHPFLPRELVVSRSTGFSVCGL